jgi:hypothetical protein
MSLLSFQVYGAIAGGRPRAKMLYSDYCKYAPQVRYGDFDHVKSRCINFTLNTASRDTSPRWTTIPRRIRKESLFPRVKREFTVTHEFTYHYAAARS